MRHLGLIILLALPIHLGCGVAPGGGVSGTLTDSSGKPIAGAELTLASSARLFVFGIPMPFTEPIRVPTTTDAFGRFGVFWSHGDRDEGPCLRYALRATLPLPSAFRPVRLSAALCSWPKVRRTRGRARPAVRSVGLSSSASLTGGA
jgi:hypothetical protein